MDKSKDGSMCPQGALNDFEFELLNPLTMDAVVDLLLIVRYRMALKFREISLKNTHFSGK